MSPVMEATLLKNTIQYAITNDHKNVYQVSISIHLPSDSIVWNANKRDSGVHHMLSFQEKTFPRGIVYIFISHFFILHHKIAKVLLQSDA
jgi:hypothetical protein